MAWPWGTYLGEEALRTGIRAKISSWQRIPANVVPHASKATGVYLNSMLAVTEAHRAGYDEAILLTPEGNVADGPGETIFVVHDGTISTPDLSTGILHGITRDSIIRRSPATCGYEVRERNLIRSDLYLADEVFMCGTAAEVTPLRSVDDHELGVGPITRALQEAYLDGRARPRATRYAAVARARAEHDPRGVSAVARAIALSGPWIDERDEELVLEVLRSGRLSLGPAGPRFEELLAEATGAPHCGRRLVRDGRPAPLHAARRRRAGRRGDHLAVLLRRLGQLRDLRGRHARLRRHRRADAQPRPGGGRGGDHAAHEARSSRSTSSATPASSTSCARSATVTGSRSSRTPARRSARATRAGRSARTAIRPCSPSTRTSRSRPARAGRSRPARREEHELLVSLRNQGRLETSSWLQHGRLGFNYRLDDISAALGIGQLEKLDRILAGRREVAARYEQLLAGVEARDAARRRRRPRPLLVRLRRQAARRCRPRPGDQLASDREGIACAPYLPSIHLQSYMRERFGFSEGLCPVSEDASARTMALPFHARLGREEQERVVEALAAALASA